MNELEIECGLWTSTVRHSISVAGEKEQHVIKGVTDSVDSMIFLSRRGD
jgi:hypothetical protein